MKALIQANNLYRYYDRHSAVQGVSIGLQKGEILGLLGPNGAGKTTTLQMLSGNLAPSSGKIIINGIDILDEPLKAKQHIGYLPDTPPLYKDLTIDEYLTFCAGLHKLKRKPAQQAIDLVLQRCNLLAVRKRLIGNLSKGFQQRTGIAQAILHNPPLIILDEPSSGLDPIQIREIRNLIIELGKNHGIILSTHALSEIRRVCTHVQILNQGHLVFSDDINGLAKAMNTATLFLATKKALDTDIFKQVSGIEKVEALQNQRYKIHHQKDSYPAEQIAELITYNGFGLLELTPESKSLEDLFVELTDMDTQASC